MKYKSLRFLLLSLLVVLGGKTFADEVTLEYTGGTTTNMTGENDAALVGLDPTAWSVVGDKGNNSNLPGLNKAGDIRIYWSNGGGNTITVSSLTGATINSISMTFTGDSYANVTVKANDADVSAGEDGSYAIGASSFVLGNGNTSNVQVRISKIVISYGASSDTRQTTTIQLGEHATSGVIGEEKPLPEFKVMAGESVVEGAVVTWSSSDEKIAKVVDSAVKLIAAGQATISASFEGNSNYMPSTAQYRMAVYEPYTSIGDMLNDISADRIYVQYSFQDLLVTYVNGSYAYVNDGTDNFLFYGSSLGLNAGDKVTGYACGQLYLYNGLPELSTSKDNISVTVSSTGNAVTPVEITADKVGTTLNQYVVVKGATFVKVSGKNLTFKVGDTEFVAYNQFNLSSDVINTLEVDKEYDITGFEGCYNATKQIFPIGFTESQGNGPVTALWSWKENLPEGIRDATNFEGKTGTLASTVSGIGLFVDATHGKMNSVGRDNAQCNAGTILQVPVVSGLDVVTVVGYPNYFTYNFDGGNDLTNENSYTATAADVERGYVEVNSKGGYVYSISVEQHKGGWTYRDFGVDLVNVLTDAQRVDKQAQEFGLIVAKDGSLTQVAVDDPNANVVLTGTYWNDHGWTNTKAVVRVEGPVQIDLGNCNYGGGDVKVVNANGETVASGTMTKGNTCWGQDNSSIYTVKYTGDATTLTITYGSYLPYIGVKAIEASSCEITYSLGDADCQGDIVPTGGTYAAGDEYTIPAKNFTLYKEGYTLTGWTDGTTTYNAGQTITLPTGTLALTPVFTKNELNLGDRTEPVTLKFDFQRQNGAPSVQWQNRDGLVWVTQATVNGKTIDVALPFSTNPGKFNNTSWNDWAQLNGGTTFHLPSCKGAVVSVEAYNELGTGNNPLTIDGQKDYTQGKTISYEIANTAETIDVVIGDEGSYYRYIQTVLPVVQGFKPLSFDNAAANIVWALTDMNEYATPQTQEPEGAFTLATVSLDQTPNGVEAPSAGANSGIKLLKLTGDTKVAEFIAKPYRGLTFTPTHVSAKVARYGTDGGTLSVTVKNAEGQEVVLATGLIPARNNKDQAGDAKGSDPNYTTEFSFDVPAELATPESFSLVVNQDGLASGKHWGIGDVHITGIVNGQTEDVAKHTIAVLANPEEGGSVNCYPQGDTFDEGTELTLTAIEKFGYDFVNWTNKAGQELSTDAKFKYVLNSDEVLTANFKKVNTYALNLIVDGTNDYMVTISPAPTVVDGKQMYEEGTAVQLTANGYEGLVTFTNWSDGETNSNKVITMDKDITITAVYAQADIIAGWDFYRAGSSGRKADFAAEDNDADVLNLVNTETGEVSGWLDKSTIGGGGYESFAGAAVNWRTGTGNGDVGNWHWQTKINAEAFTDINVQFQMLYNYNAYQTYNAEYSLDGDNWTKFGDITMTGAKAAASFSSVLPASTNNQKDLYIRMIADKTSNVDGSASANDGNTLAMFFITGTPKLFNDGKAPVLVNTVPANGATGASATGKIVLTFDERVKVKEDTKATLDNQELVPAVSGKTVTFEYKGLDYAKEYTFSLPANSVGDLTDNYLAEAITINFTTMNRPSVSKKLYDFIVPDNGSFKEALAAAAARADKSQRYRIFVKQGNYVIPANQNVKVDGNDGKQYADPKTEFGSPNVSIIGESANNTAITNELPNSLSDNPNAGKGGQANPLEGIRTSGVLYLTSGAQNTYFQDIKLYSNTADGTGRNVVLVDGGNKTICKNVTLWAYQDTYVSDNTRNFYYFEDGLLRGRTDFLCGSGDVFYNHVTLQMCEEGGYIAVPRDNVKYGYVFKDCTIKGETAKVDGNYYLGRPWTKGAEVYYIDTKMEAVPKGEGWANMSSDGCTRMAEYNSTTSTGSVIDLSARTKVLGGNPNNPVLTAEEAIEIGNLHNMYGDWDPTIYTEQAPMPSNAKLTGNQLTWDDSQYVLLWAIVKDGKVIDFTTEPSYTVDDVTAGWSVRAANEMGGLSDATVVTVNSGIEENVMATPQTNDTIYNLQGVRVKNAARGLYIINGRKVVVK